MFTIINKIRCGVDVDRILITGGSGLLGSSLVALAPSGYEVFATYRTNIPKGVRPIKIEMKDSSLLRKTIETIRPKFVIHTSAATDIEWCEVHADETYSINVVSTDVLASASKSIGAKFIYISTDSVFDGTKGWYKEDDKSNPLNVYSKTKLEGERMAAKYDDALIIRTTFYGFSPFSTKESFVPKVVRKLRQNISVKAATDVINNPLIVSKLSELIYDLSEREISGIYHIASSNVMSNYDSAIRIASIFGLDKYLIQKTTLKELSAELKWKAKRPLNTSLNPEKASRIIGIPSIDESIKMLEKIEKNYV